MLPDSFENDINISVALEWPLDYDEGPGKEGD